MSEVVPAPVRAWTGGRRGERIAYVIGAVLFTSGLVHVCVLLVTGGSWSGPVSLRKAATFGLSFGVTLVAVTWATAPLHIGRRLRPLLLGILTVTSVLETGLITVQAWRGVPSHFNFEAPLDAAVSSTLAAGGALIVLTVAGFLLTGIAGAGGLSPSMRSAVRFGLVTLFAAMVVGALMIAKGVTLVRTGDPQLAYHTAGTLKPLHAVTMHAVLVLPGLAWLLGLGGWSERRRMLLVRTGIVAYTVLSVVVAIESFNGISPLSAPPTAMFVSACAIATLVGIGLVAVGALRGTGRGADASRQRVTR